MRSGFKVGRIYGINIHIDWSWIFIFLLVTWNLAAAVFPSLHPDWNVTTNIALGIAASFIVDGLRKASFRGRWLSA